MKKILFAFWASLFVLLTGCRWHGLIFDPYFKVENSGLNWVEIRQYETIGSKQRVRLRIDGNGLVTVRDGSSALVNNSFAANMKSETWEDIREKRVTISEDDAQLIYQSLVDAGLFVKYEGLPYLDERPVPSSNETVMVFVSANINARTVGASDPVGKPDLLERLKLVVLTFYQPRPIRKQPQP